MQDRHVLCDHPANYLQQTAAVVTVTAVRAVASRAATLRALDTDRRAMARQEVRPPQGRIRPISATRPILVSTVILVSHGEYEIEVWMTDSVVDSSRGTAGSGLTGSGTGHHGHHGQHGGVGGKVDDLVHGGEHHTETANRLDPHVAGGRGPIEHATVQGSGSGLGSSTTGGYGSSNTTAGPHSSNLANKADPRVDSDRDGSRGYGSSTGTGAYGSSNTTAGPHSSNLDNKADPRVDSDLDGSRGYGSSNTMGTTGGYGSSTGTHGTTGTTGGYGSNTGIGYGDNKTSSTGTGSTTAGPHKSDMMNKLDPRVDSDLDGSKMK